VSTALVVFYKGVAAVASFPAFLFGKADSGLNGGIAGAFSGGVGCAVTGCAYINVQLGFSRHVISRTEE
jgi:hypothetical protein